MHLKGEKNNKQLPYPLTNSNVITYLMEVNCHRKITLTDDKFKPRERIDYTHYVTTIQPSFQTTKWTLEK